MPGGRKHGDLLLASNVKQQAMRSVIGDRILFIRRFMKRNLFVALLQSRLRWN